MYKYKSVKRMLSKTTFTLEKQTKNKMPLSHYISLLF